MNAPLTIDLPAEVIEQMEARIEARLLERLSATTGANPDRWIRGTDAIAEYIDAKPSRVSALISAKRFWPAKKDGRGNVARTSDLDRWIEEGGGIRP